MEIISGFECVRIIGREKGLTSNVDVLGTTQHYMRYKEDFALAKDIGIKTMRIGVPWHTIEVSEGVYNWTWMDRYMQALQEYGIDPILDPLHHVSVPSWLTNGFLDERMVESYCKFFRKIVFRYKWVTKYTIVNEPLVTTYFSCNAGVWFPFAEGEENFSKGLNNIYTIIEECAYILEKENKEHWYVDAAEYHYGEGQCESCCTHAAHKNGWRWQLLDRLVKAGVKIDVLGLDYYAHCEFEWGPEGRKETKSPIGFYNIALQYYEKYRIPIALTETNIRGYIEDRQTWFKHMYQQCLRLTKKVPFRAFCWYPFIDSTDWDSLVTEANGNIDPQGIIWLNKSLKRHQSEFSDTIKGLIAGDLHISDVNEYEYQPPLDEQLKGFVI